MGRYVFVGIPGNDKILTLCEVEVILWTGQAHPDDLASTNDEVIQRFESSSFDFIKEMLVSSRSNTDGTGFRSDLPSGICTKEEIPSKGAGSGLPCEPSRHGNTRNYGTAAYTWLCSEENIFSKAENEAGRNSVHPATWDMCEDRTTTPSTWPDMCGSMQCFKEAPSENRNGDATFTYNGLTSSFLHFPRLIHHEWLTVPDQVPVGKLNIL